MGSLVGHVLPGLAFFALGLWHLFNHVKLYTIQSSSYKSSPWFPTSRIRYLELLLIMIGSSISISMELFIGPARHQPFDPDGTIPSNHLRNFEHSSISMSFFVYSVCAIILDKMGPKAQCGPSLTQFIGAIALSQELFLFYLHSTDHKGIEGQYHLLFQIVIVVSVATTLIGIRLPRSFLISFVRSLSILFQGVWFIVMGYMIYTPGLIPKGCLLHAEDGHQVVTCGNEEALHRAKSLINIQFSWFIIGITVFAVCFYVALVETYSKKVMYSSLADELQEEPNNIESLKNDKFGDLKSSIHMEKGFATFNMER